MAFFVAAVAALAVLTVVSVRKLETHLLLHPQRVGYYPTFPKDVHHYLHLPGGGVLVSGNKRPAESMNMTLGLREMKQSEQKPIALFCHGNAGHIEGCNFLIQPLIDRGYEPWLLEYRSFGVSPIAKIKEMDDLVEDLNEAMVALAPRTVSLLIGHSMGGGVVSQWLHRELTVYGNRAIVPDQVIIANSFRSMPRMAVDLLGQGLGSMIGSVMKTRWRSTPGLDLYCRRHSQKNDKALDEKGSFNYPRLLLINAKDDNLIPRSHSEQMYDELIQKHKGLLQWREVPSGGHNMGWVMHAEEWMPFVHTHTSPTPPSESPVLYPPSIEMVVVNK